MSETSKITVSGLQRALTRLWGRITTAISTAVAGKQDKRDSGLSTRNPTIVGSINELNGYCNALDRSQQTLSSNVAELNETAQRKSDNALNTTSKTVVGSINELVARERSTSPLPTLRLKFTEPIKDYDGDGAGYYFDDDLFETGENEYYRTLNINILVDNPEAITEDTWLVFTRWNKRLRRHSMMIGGATDTEIMPINLYNLYTEEYWKVAGNDPDGKGYYINTNWCLIPYNIKDLIMRGMCSKKDADANIEMERLFSTFYYGTGGVYFPKTKFPNGIVGHSSYYASYVFSYGLHMRKDAFSTEFGLQVVRGNFFRCPPEDREEGEINYVGEEAVVPAESGYIKVREAGMRIPIYACVYMTSDTGDPTLHFYANAGYGLRRFHRIRQRVSQPQANGQ